MKTENRRKTRIRRKIRRLEALGMHNAAQYWRDRL